MNQKSSRRRNVYGPTGRKTFFSALCHLLNTSFPGQFGAEVTELFAKQVVALFRHFHKDRRRIGVGQIVWSAVDAGDPPARNKTIENTRLVPVVLDLLTSEDIEHAIDIGIKPKLRQRRVVRMLKQSYDQKGVLSGPDLALMLGVSEGTISRDILAYEKEHNVQLPRRGTIHDLGCSVSHKAAICRKRIVEKSPTSKVASDTNHSPEEVEYYVQCFQRVRLCIDKNMTTEEIALVTGHGKSIVQEYKELHDEFLCLPEHPEVNYAEN